MNERMNDKNAATKRNIPSCYGRFFSNRQTCIDCWANRYCRHAGDLPPLEGNPLPDLINERILNTRRSQSSANRLAAAERDRRYTRADLLEVIAFMVAMDRRTLEIISMKMERPDLTFADIAKSKGVSRQAIQKMVKKRILAELPELAPLVDSWQKRKQRNREAYELKTNTRTQCGM